MGSDDTLAKVKDPLLAGLAWVKKRSHKEKLTIGCFCGFLLLLILWRTIEDHDTLFIIAESVHFIGIGVLGIKLYSKQSVAGLSLQSQLLTACFLTVRLFCSFLMEYDIHTILDFLSLVATGAVVFCMLTHRRMKETYQRELDSLNFLKVLIPCAILAIVCKPRTSHNFFMKILWAFCVYLEAVSVLPQLRMMQRAKVVERFTAHYVFALGLSRFFSCAHWLLQLLDGNKYLLQALGTGLWPAMVLISEVIQTFILADFCYYYVKAYASGSGVLRMPSGIV